MIEHETYFHEMCVSPHRFYDICSQMWKFSTILSKNQSKKDENL